jgi:hypothetical protein
MLYVRFSMDSSSSGNRLAGAPPPSDGSIAGRAFRHAVRHVKGVRKQTLRGVKRAQHLIRRVRDAEKSLYFRLRDSEAGRAILKAALMARAPRETRERRNAAASYLARLDKSGIVTIDRDKGYVSLSPDSLGDFGPIAHTCRRLFETKKAEMDARFAGLENWSADRQEKYLSRKQSFLRYLLKDEDLQQHPEIVEFALSDALLGAATRYLGMVPYLSRVDLMYSLPRGSDDNIASQLFHLDHEGVEQVKVFIHLFDVGEREGPFTFIPADATTRIVGDVRSLRKRRGSRQEVETRRYSDDEIAAVNGQADIVTVKGPVGAGVAVDTSRCLHLGSRVEEGTFRLCLYLQYCATHELTNVYDVARFQGDPIRYLAVSHSVLRGRARASDYNDQIMGG